MDWTDLQNTAKTRGQLVFAMRQSQTPAMTQPGPWGTSTDGYCIGLAATWISWCYAGKTFPVDASKVCDNPPWQSTMSQTLSDAMNAAVWTDFWVAATKPFQMGLSDGLRARRETKPSASFIHSIVTQAYGCYGVTLQRSGGAHAIALRHGRDNRMHVFDANQGHFAVRDHTLLKPFLRWYFEKTGYGDRYDKGHGVVGVRPPIT
ncbi:hypothetical protein [Muricoccus radiodurans]|uniref:hypothetical protein n=1 Tax=Muricoccus radiodurans TaxID=2231721 RepID=UPI003CF8716E